MTILLATKNKHKAEELKALLAAHDIRSLPDSYPEVDETGSTLAENAKLKARAAFTAFNLPAAADDTGLEVSALNGAPGVFTARYAGDNVSYEDNYCKLIAELEGKDDRSASFKTVICYIDGEGNEHFFEGEVKGRITTEPRGAQGFGYDPVFIPDEGDGRTFAEMSSEEKNRISHRARAVMRLVKFLNN